MQEKIKQSFPKYLRMKSDEWSGDFLSYVSNDDAAM